MSNCKCDDLATTSTSSTPTPCVPFDPNYDCARIRMFFGYDTNPNINVKIKPGQLDKLYYTNAPNSSTSRDGFLIQDYSAEELVRSGILPQFFGKFQFGNISGGQSNSFDLSEIELLSTISWESWIAYQAAFIVALPDDSSEVLDYRTFGYWVLRSLDFDLKSLQAEAIKYYDGLKHGNPSGFFSNLQKYLVHAPKTSTTQTSRGPIFPSSISLDDCDLLKRAESIDKLVLAYEWLKNIHDTYYGKQFLVKIGEPVPYNGYESYPLDTICIKDDNGNYPNLSYPYFIDGDGSAQGYYLSDVISTDGGFPDKTDSNILGLTNLDWIQSESGKIGSFVRIGAYATKDIGSQCPDLYNQILYPKFHKSGSSDEACEKWRIDISKLNTDSYYLSEINLNAYYQYLYMSCSVSERFYVDMNGTWAHITLADKVPMNLRGISDAQGFIYHSILTNSASAHLPDTHNRFLQLIKNTIADLGYNATDIFRKFTEYTADQMYGARPDSALLNLTQSNPWCLIPEAAAIPFKSNIYKYGPVYYGDANAGGVDVVQDEDMAPWNFITSTGTYGSSSLPVTYTYDAMENFGKAIASGSPRDLQKLEKGRITVAGLPCYCIGHWVDNPQCYDATKEVGPTLLTDMSVEFGSGGYNTTYNFATYSPKFGKPEKYITDAWKKNIRDNQYLNKYLKSLEQKIQRNNQSYKLRLINGERGGNSLSELKDKNVFLSPAMKYKSTSNSLMFSGYKLLTGSEYNDIDNENYLYNEVYTLPSPPPIDSNCCDPKNYNPLPIINGYSGPTRRLYTFAETDKAYSIEYIQDTYYQLSGMSLDGFYLPVSLRGANKNPNIKEYQKNSDTNTFIVNNDKLQPNSSWINSARLPRFAKRCENNGVFIEWDAISSSAPLDRDKTHEPGMPISSKTRDEIPPFNLISGSNPYCYNMQINQRYLNPILSEKNLLGDSSDSVQGWDDRKNNSDHGFVISSIIFGQDHIDYQITHTDKQDIVSYGLDQKDSDEFIRQQFKNFRFPAMRGPLVLQSWGYDTSGKPIPNSADGWGHAQMGEFRKDSLTDSFMKNWLQYPKTWPVGPIDLRFDRERGVWTCPSPNKIVVARLKEKLLPNSGAKAELINPIAGDIHFYEHYSISGPNGENIKLRMSLTEITVYDFLGVEYCQCDIVYAYYDDNRYIVLESNRGYKDPSDVLNCTACTTPTTTVTTTPPCSNWYGHSSLKNAANYDESKQQILGHDVDGCLVWYDILDCGSTPTIMPS